VGSADGNLYAVDASTGTKKWSWAAGDRLDNRPAVSPDGATVFMTELTFGKISPYLGQIHAVNASTGIHKWSLDFTGAFNVLSDPAVSHDGATVFVGSTDGNEDGQLYAVDASTGIEKWSFPAVGGMTSSPTVSLDGATVFVGATDDSNDAGVGRGHLYAVDASTGIGKWRFATNGSVYSSPAVSGDGATVFVGSNNGTLYAVNASTGIEKWSFPPSALRIRAPR